MLVCPNCHAKIHRRPDLYPIERLRLAKWHWESMSKLIPTSICDPRLTQSFHEDTVLRVPFVLETFNLRYEIVIPRNATIRETAEFVASYLLRPAFAFARTSPFPSVLASAECDHVELVLQSDPRVILSAEALVRDIGIDERNALVAATDIKMVCRLAKEVEKEKEEFEVETASLRWGAMPRDLDLHFLVEEDGRNSRVWFRELGTLKRFPWAQLSEDIRTGFGPETLSFGLLARGQYTIAVHNYSNETPLAGSDAILELAIRGKSQVFQCPSEGHGRWWKVCRLDVASGNLEEFGVIVDSDNDLISG
jgi:hypothetical protein